MKKIIVLLGLFLSCTTAFSAVPEQYVRDVERISEQYNADMKFFLRSLDPKITHFNTQQQSQFCAIVKKYVDDMYLTTDQNRKYLPAQIQSVSKQQVIDKVMSSPEMQILKKYNIQCNLQ